MAATGRPTRCDHGLPTRTLSRVPSVEAAAAALILAGLGLVVWRFLQTGYLPQPFYYRVSESLMDLYSPAAWANTSRAYNQWTSVYPPLSFVFLQLSSLKGCYALGDLAARHCDWLARLVLCAFFALNIALTYATYRIADAGTAAPRAIAMTLGLPMLYALERGNLLIPCFTCFALGYGEVLRVRWLRCVALALSMNFKPYLGLVALPLVIRRYWGWVLGCGVFSVVVYLVTLFIYGSGSPLQILANERDYAVAASKSYFGDLYYATSFWPLIRILDAFPPGLRLAPAPVEHAWSLGLTAVLRVAQLASLACLLAAVVRPGGVNVRRLGALLAGTAITAYTTGSAGYAQIFLFFLIFFEPWRGPLRIALLLSAYLLCLPIDLIVLPVVHGQAWSFLGGREIMANFGVSIGQLVRPGVLLIIQYGLIVLNLRDIFAVPRVTVDDGFAKPPRPVAGGTE